MFCVVTLQIKIVTYLNMVVKDITFCVMSLTTTKLLLLVVSLLELKSKRDSLAGFYDKELGR